MPGEIFWRAYCENFRASIPEDWRLQWSPLNSGDMILKRRADPFQMIILLCRVIVAAIQLDHLLNHPFADAVLAAAIMSLIVAIMQLFQSVRGSPARRRWR
jgi:hypothetical protein